MQQIEGARPYVSLANFAKFKPGQKIAFHLVQSRMILWCISGKGRVEINTEAFPFSAGNFLFIPWLHQICYQADFEDPFHLAGIHLIADYRSTEPFPFLVSHCATSSAGLVKEYFDIPLPGLEKVFSGEFGDFHGLYELCLYVVQRFPELKADPRHSHWAARMLLLEMQKTAAYRGKSKRHPPALQKMIEHIKGHYSEEISLKTLGQLADVDRATVNRLFNRNLGCTPLRYLTGVRLAQAERLISGTSDSVEEIGRQVGVADPYYFSRLFKKNRGISASEYRKRFSLI
ncbi:MAG: helix-turn-helix domain-containing protein [Planctomycetes bacterium]|nr:helix-turn-helix domain-containing protein [Planctomycetota bacterium]